MFFFPNQPMLGRRGTCIRTQFNTEGCFLKMAIVRFSMQQKIKMAIFLNLKYNLISYGNSKLTFHVTS